ncbi:uncharacterized protein lrrc74b [Lampris incognitus]|uniref:uncharacterized protein lrrc74b n=1 Tax=Lampris incognitus TaxID=2546036 RepID=UPI0024B4E3EF|nr:uncharacterized protein lrrc74b [Lampris incognitus]
MLHAYNCTRSGVTGFSPYYLLYGRSPRLPVDLLFNLQPSETKETYTEYVQNWQNRMQQAYEIASKTAAREALRGKRGYDRVHGVDLQPGGRVLVRNLSKTGGPGKLRSYWESKVHVVVKRRSSDSPVYEVAPEGGGKSRVLHRNLLLPCDSLPLDKPEPAPAKQERRKVQMRTRTRQHQINGQVEDSDSESSDEVELVCRFPHYHEEPSKRAADLNPEEEPFAPALVMKDGAPDLEEAAPVQEDAEADIGDIAAEADGENDTAEPGESLQESTAEPGESLQESTAEPGESLQESSEEDDPDPPPATNYPQRARHRPRMLTYTALGEPTWVEAGAESLHTVNRARVDSFGPTRRHSGPEEEEQEGGERQSDDEEAGVEEEENDKEEAGEQQDCVISDYDTDLELEDRQEAYDLTGQTRYMEACKLYHVVPASHVLRNMQNSELSMMHCGLGPQGAKALAVPLVTNTSILRLNLRDNWMEGMGGAAMAEMLKENCYVTEVDLSDNRLGEQGAQAMASMLRENITLRALYLSGNHLNDRAAQHLGLALIGNTKLESLDLSHNCLGEAAGETLGESLSENTGLRSLSLAWNAIRGRGAVMLARGIGANIFLRTLDLSYNGLGKEGAIALGEALKENNTLVELDLRNNRIPPEGAIRFALGLRVNKTMKALSIGRNPIQCAGCYGILKSLQGNPASAMETLDFSDIPVNQDFEDLYAAVKEILPSLAVKHVGRVDIFRKPKS